MPSPTQHLPIDGLVDAATVGVGILVTGAKTIWRTKTGKAPSFSAVTTDFLNATVITPFVLMVGAVFSGVLLDYLRSASPVSTAIAGAIGLLFVCSEMMK